MRLYRYSPIDSREKLAEAMEYIHRECHTLCRRALGEELPIAGNLAVFCHYDEEYAYLTSLRSELCHEDHPAYGKYYCLREPLRIAASADAPAATYTHLYIRRPDPYRHHVGDVDFYLEPERYAKLKRDLRDGTIMPGLRLYPLQDVNMLELHDPDSDVLGYIVDTPLSDRIPK